MRPTRLWALLLAAVALPAAAEPILFENARVFDGQRDRGITPVLIDGARIVHIGTPLPAAATGARRVDYTGKTLLPALVSDHAHVGNTQGLEHGDRFYTRDNVVRDLRQFQRYGITTVTALGMNGADFFALRTEVNADPRLGAQLYGAGGGIGAPDGAPPADSMGLRHDPVARPRTAEQARAAIATQHADGVDLIKLWVDDLGGKRPMMTPEVYRAAIAEAHARGLTVAAHIHDLDQARDLVDARVDILAHGIRDRAVDPMLARKMRDQGTWYIPTVAIDEANYWYAEHPQALQQPFLRQALHRDVLARWSQPEWQRAQLAGSGIPAARAAVATNLGQRAPPAGGRGQAGFRHRRRRDAAPGDRRCRAPRAAVAGAGRAEPGTGTAGGHVTGGRSAGHWPTVAGSPPASAPTCWCWTPTHSPTSPTPNASARSGRPGRKWPGKSRSNPRSARCALRPNKRGSSPLREVSRNMP
ncbi:amidohydrolase family protein [Stenotrophomonas rhizophila]